jgi:hypothetical protein
VQKPTQRAREKEGVWTKKGAWLLFLGQNRETVTVCHEKTSRQCLKQCSAGLRIPYVCLRIWLIVILWLTAIHLPPRWKRPCYDLMSSPKTVFVIGAGASKEAGLPLGSELRDQIKPMVNLQFEGLGVSRH